MRQFVESLLPTDQEDTGSPRWSRPATRRRCARRSSSTPATSGAIVALAELLVALRRRAGRHDEALALLERIPEIGRDPPGRGAGPHGRRRRRRRRRRVEAKLDALLDRVKDDEDARQEFVDVLELLGPDDPRTAAYRKSSRPAVLMGPG